MDMDKSIYIKKIGNIGKYIVWLVDGAKVRKDINENFVKCSVNNKHDFVPENEFWIDEDMDPKEYKYFMDRFTYEQGLLDSGTDRETAEKMANDFEIKERQNSPEMIKIKEQSAKAKDLIEKIKKQRIKEYEGKVEIWIVDGNLVRSFLFIDYCEGGHDLVYNFVPKNEIWIEEALSPQERKFIILHELHERHLMSQGKNYKNAHTGATEIEDRYRDNPKGLEERIKEEMNRQI